MWLLSISFLPYLALINSISNVTAEPWLQSQLQSFLVSKDLLSLLLHIAGCTLVPEFSCIQKSFDVAPFHHKPPRSRAVIVAGETFTAQESQDNSNHYSASPAQKDFVACRSSQVWNRNPQYIFSGGFSATSQAFRY